MSPYIHILKLDLIYYFLIKNKTLFYNATIKNENRKWKIDNKIRTHNSNWVLKDFILSSNYVLK